MKKIRKKYTIKLFLLYGIAILMLMYSYNYLMDKADTKLAKTANNNIQIIIPQDKK